MIYGYARVSTKGTAKDGNSLETQENALRAAGHMHNSVTLLGEYLEKNGKGMFLYIII